MEQKAWVTVQLFYNMFDWVFWAHSLDLPRKKKIPFKILVFTDNIPGHPRALMQMWNWISVVLMYANPVSIL